MYYGLVMRVKVNGKMKQFGVLDQYGNVLKMTHSELLKHTRKGDVVNLAPNGDFFTGKNCSITDIPIFDDKMNQISGIPYDSYFNMMANEIYKQAINAEQKSLLEEQEKQFKEQQEKEKQAQKQEQRAFVSLAKQEKQEQDAIDKSIEAMGKLGSMAKKEMNKRLNKEKYLDYLDRVDHLMNMMEHYGSQCVKAKTITNNKLRQSGATLYNRQMDATTNDAKLNNYILVHGIIEVRNRIAAYYTQARNIIEQELTTKDREFYLNRLSECKLYVGRIQDLHKETSNILKENVAHKERVEEQEKREKEVASQIDSITRQINVITNSKVPSIRYIKGKLGDSKARLKDINDELDSLYNQATQNPEVLEATEGLFSNAMQAIVSKEEEIEQCQVDYEAELEAQKAEEARKAEESKVREEEARLAAQEKERQAKIVGEVRKEYERALTSIVGEDNIDLIVQERNNFEKFIYGMIQEANSDELSEKLNLTLESFNTKVEDIVTKLEFKRAKEEEKRRIEEAKEEERKAKEEAHEVERKRQEEIEQNNKELLNNAETVVKSAKNQISSTDKVQDILSIADTVRSNIQHPDSDQQSTIGAIDSLVKEFETYVNEVIHKLQEVKAKEIKKYKDSLDRLYNELGLKEFNGIIENKNTYLLKADSYKIGAETTLDEEYWQSDKEISGLMGGIIEQYTKVVDILDKAEGKQASYQEKLASREQYVINYINSLSVADTDEEEKRKLSGIENHLIVKDSTVGTLDITNSEMVQSAITNYKEKCRVAKEEKAIAIKKSESESKVLKYISGLGLVDTEESKNRALSKIYSMCESSGINVENSTKIKQAIADFENSCNNLISRKEELARDIEYTLQVINNLPIVASKKECENNISNIKNTVSFNAFYSKDVETSIKEYKSKCKQASAKLVNARSRDMMVETSVKNKLSVIAFDSDIRSASSEEKLAEISNRVQSNLDRAYKAWDEHWFVDESKGSQCKRAIYNYRDKMEDKLNDRLKKLSTSKSKKVGLEDFLWSYKDSVSSDYNESIIHFALQNILKLIHGYFYDERHSTNEDTDDFKLDLLEETWSSLKYSFEEAIDYLLKNTVEKDMDALESGVQRAFEDILDDEYINGMNLLRSKHAGEDAYSEYSNELDLLYDETLSKVRNFRRFSTYAEPEIEEIRLTLPEYEAVESHVFTNASAEEIAEALKMFDDI